MSVPTLSQRNSRSEKSDRCVMVQPQVARNAYRFHIALSGTAFQYFMKVPNAMTKRCPTERYIRPVRIPGYLWFNLHLKLQKYESKHESLKQPWTKYSVQSSSTKREIKTLNKLKNLLNDLTKMSSLQTICSNFYIDFDLMFFV